MRSPNSRCPRCARRCISASCSPTAWPLAGSHANGARQRRCPRNHRAGGRTAAVADMTRAATEANAASASASAHVRPRIRTPKRGFARATPSDIGKGDLYTARLTLDITPAMRARIKVSAFTQGVTVAELLRGLLEREFPRRTHHERIRLACQRTAARLRRRLRFRALAGQAGNVPLTRVSLAYVEQRFNLYLRFGEPARTLQLDRWRRCAVFLPASRCSAASAGSPTTTARSAGNSW